jgi:2',3'-cyclic-nucleotide 2'-phosphodiesterase (5'-nucleotidase family)
MKKLAFVIGVGVGFLLGSKTGSGPYRGLETRVRSFVNRPEVQSAVEAAEKVAADQVTQVVGKSSDRIAGAGDQDQPFPNSA